MRRAQSVRHYGRSTQAHNTDDLGVLKEDESVEDVLRRQLLEKDRECDRVRASESQAPGNESNRYHSYKSRYNPSRHS